VEAIGLGMFTVGLLLGVSIAYAGGGGGGGNPRTLLELVLNDDLLDD